jgi:hypothetical protein
MQCDRKENSQAESGLDGCGNIMSEIRRCYALVRHASICWRPVQKWKYGNVDDRGLRNGWSVITTLKEMLGRLRFI